MKRQVKRKLISILLIIFILADIFSPYSILLNKSYAVVENELSIKPAVVLNRVSEIKDDKIDTDGNTIRYFDVEIGMMGPEEYEWLDEENLILEGDAGWRTTVTQLKLQYNTNKLGLLNNKTNAILSESEQYKAAGNALQAGVTRYINPVAESLTFVYSETQTNINVDGFGTFTIESDNSNDLATPVFYEMVSGESKLNGAPYMPIATMQFAILDDDINESNLTQDLITLRGIDTNPTGMMITYYDNATLVGDTTYMKSITGADGYFAYNGFVAGVKVIDTVSIAETNVPTKTEYEHGDTIDLTGGKITVNYTDGSSEEIDMPTPSEMANSSDFTLTKEKVTKDDTKVTITYLDKWVLEYDITVSDPIVKIILETHPDKIEYLQGEDIDFTGAQIRPLTKSDIDEEYEGTNSLKKIEVVEGIKTGEVTVSDTIADIAKIKENDREYNEEGLICGPQKITLTYQDFSCELPITVNDQIIGIAVSDNVQTDYEYGDSLNLKVGTVYGVTKYSGNIAEINLNATDEYGQAVVTVSGYNPTNIATQKLTVSYLGFETEYEVTVTDPIQGIEFELNKDKLVYQPEEELDLEGFYVYPRYKSGPKTEEKVALDPNSELYPGDDAISIKGYNSRFPGVQTITVSYLGKTNTFNVTILDAITSIEVTGMKTEYKYGDRTLDISNAKLTLKRYSGAEEPNVPLTASMVKTDLDGFTLGEQKIKVEYEESGNVISTLVTVKVSDVVEAITIKETPKTRYAYGETLNVEGGVITVEWKSGADDTEVDITADMIRDNGSNFNSNVTFPEGKTTVTKPLTVIYGEGNTSYDVTIVNEITGIAMKTIPKTEYNVNDTLDVTNGEITITRQIGTEDKALDSNWVSGFDSSTDATEKELTVTYTENDVTKTTSYDINVKDTVKTIEVISQPTKTVYGWGEELNLDGAKIKVTKGSGTEEIPVTRDMITNYDKESVTQQSLIVEYPVGSEITSKTNIIVTVVDKVKSIEMGTIPQTEYKIDEAINLNGTIIVTRQSGATETKDLGASGVTIEGFSSEQEAKDKRIYVKYEEQYLDSSTASGLTYYDINVLDKITKIEVTTLPDEIKTFNYGQIFSTTGGKVTLTKESGATEEINLSDCVVSGYSETKLGDQAITVEYSRDGVTKSCIYYVTVNNYVDRIEITPPSELNYGWGDPLILDGGYVTKIMADETSDIVALSDSGVTIVDKETVTQQIGENIPVTVEYAGAKSTFNINVTDNIKEIVLVNELRLVYNYGEEEFDTNGAYYNVVTNSGRQKEVQITPSMIDGFYTDKLTGTQEDTEATRRMTITVNGRVFPYDYVVNDYLKEIEIVEPTITRYAYTTDTTAKLDITGAKLKKKMASGDEVSMGLTATGVSYTEYTPNQLGTQIITVTLKYTESGIEKTKTGTFSIVVRDELVDIQLTAMPKQKYIYGESFSANGAKLKVTYLSKTEDIEITENMLSGFITSGENALTNGTARTATITYSYADANDPVITDTTTFTYEVEDQVEDINLTEPTTKTYYYGETSQIDLTGGTVQAVMKSGIEQEIVNLEDIRENVTGYVSRPNDLGDQTITVNYAGKTKTFTITMKDRLEGVSIVGEPVKAYRWGDQIDLNGAKLAIDRLKNDEQIDITPEMVKDFTTTELTAEGETRTATIPFVEDGVEREATFNYTVSDYIKEIAGVKKPSKLEYYLYALESEFDYSDGFVEITMASGLAASDISLTDSRIKVTGFDSSSLGTKAINIEFTNEKGEKLPASYNIEIKDRLEGIRLIGTPKTAYLWDEELDLNGATIEVTKLSGTKTEEITEDMISGFTSTELTEEGKPRKVTISYTFDKTTKTADFTYTVADFIESVAIKAPSTLTYYYNEELKLDDAYLVITMASRTEVPNVKLTSDDVTLTGYEKEELGNHTVYVEYKGFINEFQVEVKDRLEAVTIVGEPKTAYLWGEELDLNGATLSIDRLKNDEVIKITEDMISGFTSTELTEEGKPRKVTISYTFDKITKTDDFEYTIGDYIDSVNLVAPSKVTYYYGEELALEDGYFEITMASGTPTDDVYLTDSRVIISDYESEKLETQTVKAMYQGFEKTFDVTVKDRLEGITIVGEPKTAYNWGEPLDLRGAKIKLDKLSEDVEVDIDVDTMVTGFTSTELTVGGARVVTISYTFDGITKTTGFAYTVGDYISDVTLTAPSKRTYYLGEELVLDDGKLAITMASGDPADDVVLTNPGVQILNYYKNTLGEQTVTVKYAGFEKTFDVTVKDRLESIEIVGEPKTSYLWGEELDLKEATINVVKLSGKTPAEITEDMISGFTSTELTKGTPRKVTISYEFDGVTKTDDFEYEVEDFIKDVTLKAPNTVEYNFGSELDLTDSYLIISMASGEEAENVPLTSEDVTITGYKKDELGSQIVKVEYEGFEEEFGVVVVDKVKTVTFDITSIAAKDYKYGDSLDLSEATAEIENLSGAKIPVEITNSMVSGYNPTKLGKQTVTITVAGHTEEIEVNVIDYITGIELTAPTKKLYIVKEELDLSGGSLKVTMASKATETLDLTEDMISGYEKTKLGPQTVTVKYEEFEKEFAVQVVDKLADISIEDLPIKTEYNYGDELDLTGAKLRVTNESDEFKVIEITEDMVTGYEATKLGTQIITVTYTNEEKEEKTTTFSVTVNDYVKEIKFTEPEKLEYKWGEELDLTGAKFTEILASGGVNEVVYVTPEMVTKFDNKVVGKQTLTATYGKTKKEFEVSVVDNLLSMAINNLPHKIEYIKGENIVFTGGEITIIKDSGIYNFDITNDMVTGFDPNVIGTQILTVKYQGLEAKLSVVVKEAVVEEPVKTPVKKPSRKPASTTTTTEETTAGLIENVTEEDTNANASENKDKENNNDIDKDITLAEKEQNADKNNEANGSVVVKTVTVSGLGIVALISLAFILKRKKNVKVYEEDESELILVGKEKLDEEERIIDISKYVQNAPNKNIILVLDKNIANKLDKQTIKIKLDNEELEAVVEYEDGDFEIRIEE